jgi:hypothetical protein
MVGCCPPRFGASPKEGIMKRTSKFAVAVFLFVTAVTAMPRLASAATSTAAATAAGIKGESTDQDHKDWSVVAAMVTAMTEVVL